ncbi:MAG: redoxin domain-containing protein [Pirellulales bacterium]
MTRFWQLLPGLTLIAVLASGPLTAAESSLGQPAPDFRLSDSAGAPYGLADVKDARLVAVIFLGTECPLARLYAPRLNALAAEYAERGVRLIGIDANVQDTAEEIAAYVREHELSFPVLRDAGNVVADQFQASRTPEVFLLDEKRVVRYRGRIDGQYQPGVQKTSNPRRDLALAIDELLAGQEVSQPQVEAVGCFIGRSEEPEELAVGAITYSQHIAAIFQKHCVECHREGEIAPFALSTYEDALGWGATIREVVDQGRMPPWFADPAVGHFQNDPRLSDEEKQQIRQWVTDGCPQGDPKDLPAPRVFAKGWNIPEPDLVLKMSERPFRVPAEGVVDYQHFVIDPGFKEDKWMIACEARPGNRQVVHHILVFLQQPGGELELLRGSLLAAYAPGSPPRVTDPGMAKHIPAGSKIIFQMHYTPNGKPQEDISTLGLKFCDAGDVKQVAESGWVINLAFAIPPGVEDYKITSKHEFADDRLLLGLTPHMHMRGKSFRYEARYPDGTRETLLNVPHWDFNWQIDYLLAEPKLMPKGTVLFCEAHYDNSPKSPTNPDPTKWVRFGEQTWDEMMIGWFTTATLPGRLPSVQPAAETKTGDAQ